MSGMPSRASMPGLAVPGLGHLLCGRPMDGAFMLLDLVLVVVALVAGPGRLRLAAATPGESTLPAWLALAAAAITLGVLWGAARRLAWPRPASITPRGRAWSRLADDRWGRLGLHLVATLLLAALLAPLLAPHAPDAVGLAAALSPPQAGFWLGTDAVGRDCLSRLLYGARISLPIGVLAVGVAAIVGTAVGGIGGYLGGWTDRLLLGLTDLLMALPRLVLLLAVVAVLGGAGEGRMVLVAAVLGLTGWMPVARVVRAEILSLRQRPFVLAARSLGLSTGAVLTRHVLPNALTPVIVNASLMVGSTILLEAALSFLGLGVPQPVPSWGGMVGSGMHHLHAWWLAVFPGLAIALTVLGFNLLGDGLQAAVDPRD